MIQQQEYYDIEKIEARLSGALGTDAWENIKKTDLGKALLRFGANIVHQDAIAFFTGLDQFFKSTVTMSGYLEEIAKSQGVIPETYISANITVSMYSLTDPKSYAPMDLSFVYSGIKFYNISDIIIGDISNPTTVVLYEGNAVREASEAGQSSGSLWSYSQLRSPISVKVGDKVIRRYLMIPKEAFVDSIMVESSQSFLIPFIRWQRVNTWYNVSQVSRSWLLGKDFLGRYKIEFGDGVYGRTYPSNEITGIRYLLSKGAGIEVDDLESFKIFFQDFTEITSVFNVLSVSDLVDGFSEANQGDLHLQIEGVQTTRDALVTELDYKNYLESRSDVKSAVIIFERKSDPPNIELFNTVSYAVKPNAEGGSFNNASIQQYFRKLGLDTVEFKNSSFEYTGFNIKVFYSALEGYSLSSIGIFIDSVLTDEFSWANLGFDERITEARVYERVKDIEGLDLKTLQIIVESVVMKKDTGATQFDIVLDEVVSLDFYPKRFKIYGKADEFVLGTTAKDSGMTGFYGDMTDREQFDMPNEGVQRNVLNINNMMFTGLNSGTRYRLIELRKDRGGVNSVWFDFSENVDTTIIASCHVDRYNEVATLEDRLGVWWLRTYLFSSQFFNPMGFDYLQLEDSFEALEVKTKELSITAPVGVTDVGGMVYYNSYLYVLWMVTGNAMLMRYRITQTTIDVEDSDYNSIGYLELSAKVYRNMLITESIFTDENVLWIASDDGIDAARNFDDGDGVYYEPDFFNTIFVTPAYSPPIDWKGLSTDGANLYGIRVDGVGQHVITKLYSISASGTCQVKNLSDDSLDNITAVLYDNFEGRVRVYFFDSTENNLYYIDFDDENQVPEYRAGTTTGTVESIEQIGVINHGLREIKFSSALTNVSIWFESEEEIEYDGIEMAVMVDLLVV